MRLNSARALAALALALAVPAPTCCADALARAGQDYTLRCQGCHGAEGIGVPHKVPSLRDSVGKLMHLDEGRDFLLRVPGASNSPLSDEALAGVLNWLVVRFGEADKATDARPFSAADVAAARRRPLVAVHRTRLEIATRLAQAGLAPPQDY